VLREPFQWPGSSSTPELSEKLVMDNMMSRLRSNRAQGRVGPGDPRGGGGTPPGGRPPGVYFTSLTLGGRPITVKLCGRSRTSKGRRGPGTPHPGGGRGFRATSRPSPSTTSSGSCRGAEPEERGGVPQVLERRLSSPPGLMKIFKLR